MLEITSGERRAGRENRVWENFASAAFLVGERGLQVSERAWENGSSTTASAPEPVFDAQDRLVTFGDFTYGWTEAGELESKVDSVTGDAWSYTYDELGNLVAATLPDGTQLDYVIDGMNRRIGKKRDGVYEQGFLYAGPLRVIAELDGSNNVVSTFVYATRKNVPDLMKNGGVTYRIVTDHLGSVRLVVNTSTGAVAQQMDYDVWGNVLVDTNPGFQPFGFAGGLYDRDLDLVRFGARDYAPYEARWTAKDPILFRGGDTNLYGYVLQDPVNGIDPTGHGNPQFDIAGGGMPMPAPDPVTGLAALAALLCALGVGCDDATAVGSGNGATVIPFPTPPGSDEPVVQDCPVGGGEPPDNEICHLDSELSSSDDWGSICVYYCPNFGLAVQAVVFGGGCDPIYVHP